MRCTTGKTEAGFTLLEVLVALLTVSAIVVSYISIRTSALADGMEARNWRLARELAEERMSEILAGAFESELQAGSEQQFEKYRGFSYQVVVGEASVGELEASLASDAADEDSDAQDRSEWQQNRDLYRKASARGLSALEYQDQIAAEEQQRRLEDRVPSETEFEQVAVVVYFPKLNARYESQRESFIIKTKASTLALKGKTPEEARQIAASRGEGDPTAAQQSGFGGGGGNSPISPSSGGSK